MAAVAVLVLSGSVQPHIARAFDFGWDHAAKLSRPARTQPLNLAHIGNYLRHIGQSSFEDIVCDRHNRKCLLDATTTVGKAANGVHSVMHFCGD